MNALVYGAGVLGTQVYHLIKTIPEICISGFIDDTKEIGTPVISNLKVLENRKTLENKLSERENSAKKNALILAIGPKNLAARWDAYLWCKEKKFILPNLIHPDASIDASASIGMGNIILANATVDYEVSLGDINYLDIGSLISHNSKIGNNNFLTTGCATAGNVKFGNHNFVGMHSAFIDNIEIGDENYFSAKNLITRNVTYKRRVLAFQEQKSFPN